MQNAAYNQNYTNTTLIVVVSNKGIEIELSLIYLFNIGFFP